MKHKTAELEGELLDAAVWLAQGNAPVEDLEPWDFGQWWHGSPSTSWDDAGIIIESDGIGTEKDRITGVWCAELEHPARADGAQRTFASGPTPLVAAMRAFVASRLGDEVELP